MKYLYDAFYTGPQYFIGAVSAVSAAESSREY